VDWKATLNLPKTEFAMRGDLAKREPQWLERWARERQYERVLAARAADNASSFVLHDGPPYPTGGIHYGTVLNKVLKDIVVRSQLMMGKRAVFRPGGTATAFPSSSRSRRSWAKTPRASTPRRSGASARSTRSSSSTSCGASSSASGASASGTIRT
jgi:tRNA synthetases class I (I, L, M and V)